MKAEGRSLKAEGSRQKVVGSRSQSAALSAFRLLPFSYIYNGINLSYLNLCIMSHFEELKVWQKAIDLAVKVYEITQRDRFNKDFGLGDQMRRSAVSISSNISEGDQLDSDKSSIRHFRIAKGSAAELYTQSIISSRIGYLEKRDFEYLKQECQEILGMLTNLIKYRNIS